MLQKLRRLSAIAVSPLVEMQRRVNDNLPEIGPNEWEWIANIGSLRVAKWVRLWGKKRGTRMSGWWVVGSVSEAAFFGALFILGIVSLTIVASSQVFFSDSTILPTIGFGFWLMVIASSSFIVIGLTAFLLQVSQTLASPEQRSVLVDKAKRDHRRRAAGSEKPDLANLPSLRALTDSPGVKLAYRLAIQRGETTPLVLSSLFSVAWNAMLSVLAVIAAENHLRGTPDWFLTVLLVPFGIVSFFSTRWFFRTFRRQSGIGPTAVEIDALPLVPGRSYRLYVCQYGRTTFAWYRIWLVSYEESTYQQGTDIRTERVETFRLPISDLTSAAGNSRRAKEQSDEQPSMAKSSGELEFTGGRLEADPENPLEMDCQFRLPVDMMHSFQGRHNAIVWKIVVEGEVNQWPSFCRSFPVVVFPPDAV